MMLGSLTKNNFTKFGGGSVLTAALVVLTTAMAAVIFAHFSPGALSPDSISILSQARSGVIEDGHPPLMAAIWGLLDKVWPGPIGMLLLNLTLFYGGLFLIYLWTAPRYGWNVLFVFFVVGLYPPIVGILGAIWIDITMAGFFLSAIGFSLLGISSQKKSVRVSALLFAMILTWLGTGLRHNAAAAALPLVSLFVFQNFLACRKLLFRLVFTIICGLFITVFFFFSSKQISAHFVDVPRHFWRFAALYDIAGTSYHENSYLFHSGVLNDHTLDDIRKLYSPYSITPLLLGEQVHAPPGQTGEKGRAFVFSTFNPDLNQNLLSNWRDVIVSHPRSYLKHRVGVFASLVIRSQWGLWAPVFDFVYPNNLNIPERNAKNTRYFQYVRSLAQKSAIFVPLTYLFLSTILVVPTLIIGLRFQNQTLLVAAALFTSGLTHIIGLFFVAASADFRYSHWMIVTSVLAASLVALELVRKVQIRVVRSRNPNERLTEFLAKSG